MVKMWPNTTNVALVNYENFFDCNSNVMIFFKLIRMTLKCLFVQQLNKYKLIVRMALIFMIMVFILVSYNKNQKWRQIWHR